MYVLKQVGFTLIELLVALVILGMLVGIVGPQFFGKVDSSKVKTGHIQVDMLKVALQTYRLDTGSYPNDLDLLWRPSGNTKELWGGPYIDGRIPLDPWSRDYEYGVDVNTDHGFYLFSFGADGVAGGDGLNADIGYFLLEEAATASEDLR